MKTDIFRNRFWTVFIPFTIVLIGYVIFITTFSIFPSPNKTVLTFKCDYEGLRQATVLRVDGNAVTNESIHVSIDSNCGPYEDNEMATLIFTADNVSDADDDVKISWLAFDTLKIAYKKWLKIYTQLDKVEFADSTLNLSVTYEKME